MADTEKYHLRVAKTLLSTWNMNIKFTI